eukprot:jgi/Chrzof1/6685/Cz19g05200.t1
MAHVAASRDCALAGILEQQPSKSYFAVATDVLTDYLSSACIYPFHKRASHHILYEQHTLGYTPVHPSQHSPGHFKTSPYVLTLLASILPCRRLLCSCAASLQPAGVFEASLTVERHGTSNAQQATPRCPQQPVVQSRAKKPQASMLDTSNTARRAFSSSSSKRDKQRCEVQQHSTKLGTPSVRAQDSAAAPASAADIPFLNRKQELQSLDVICSRWPFFNRKQELQSLNVMFSRRPTSITVLLGPRNTGKSALLKEYMRTRDLAGTKCYIDARMSTPDALGRALLELSLPKVARQVQGLFSSAKNIAQTVGKALEALGNSEVTISGKAISAVLAALGGDKEAKPPLSAVIRAYRVVLDAWDEARAQGQLEDSSPPLLVLDEAHVLMRWSEQHKTDLQELLRFLMLPQVAMLTEHVDMLLLQRSGQGSVTLFVFGDLNLTHAREYLNQRLQLLHKALIQVVKDVARTLQPGYLPPPTAGYTAADCATAVKAILDSPYKAVDEDLLSSQLGSLEPLQAMVKANLLALRPFSPWAYDVSAKAFGPERLATVITAPSALHLYLMEVQRGKLLEALDAMEATISVTQRSGSPSSLELQEVRQQIKEVELEIKEVAAQLEAAEEAGNEGKAARLGRKEEQLRQKKQSLREIELLLLKAVLLLKAG